MRWDIINPLSSIISCVRSTHTEPASAATKTTTGSDTEPITPFDPEVTPASDEFIATMRVFAHLSVVVVADLLEWSPVGWSVQSKEFQWKEITQGDNAIFSTRGARRRRTLTRAQQREVVVRSAACDADMLAVKRCAIPPPVAGHDDGVCVTTTTAHRLEQFRQFTHYHLSWRLDLHSALQKFWLLIANLWGKNKQNKNIPYTNKFLNNKTQT